MRRAAALAIALVVGLLLLPSVRTGPERAPRHDAHTPEEPEAATSAAREAPEPGAREKTAATRTDALAEGVVTDAEGRPVPGRMVFAIPRDEETFWDMEEPDLPRGDAPDLPFAATDAEGAFAFRGLPPGEYRLAIGEDWTPEARVLFREDARGLRVVAVRTWTTEIVVLDLETSEPIPRFRVRYRGPQDARGDSVSDGSDGVFRARLRHGILACRVEAEGYHAGTALAPWSQEPADRNVWLARDDEPRLVLRILFDDGAPCEEEATVHVRHLTERRNSILPAVRDGAGRYRVALPPGSWILDFRPAHSGMFRESCSAEVHLLAGERSETFLTLPRGGDILVRRNAFDGAEWTLVVSESNETASITAATASRHLRHMKPGRYRLDATLGPATADSAPRWWRRQVEVTTGSSQELTIE